MGEKVFFSQDAKTDNLIFNNNNYFNTPSLVVNPDGGSGKVFDTTGLSLTQNSRMLPTMISLSQMRH